MALKDATFLNAGVITLVTIDLADPDGVRDSVYTSDPGASPTLRFSDLAEPYTYSANVYYPGILSWSGRMAGSAFSGRKSDADGTLVLSTGRYVWQKKGAAAPQESAEYLVHLTATMRSYLWSGALVTVTVLAEKPSGAVEAQQVFVGRVNDPGPIDEDSITIQCVEDKAYNRRKPDADGPANGSSETRWVVNTEDYPNAPAGNIGKTLPLVYTEEAPVLESNTDECLAINAFSLRGLWPGVVIDQTYELTGGGEGIAAKINAYQGAEGDDTADIKAFLYISELNTVARVYTTGTGGTTDDYHHTFWMVTAPSDDTEAIIYMNPTKMTTVTSGVTNIGMAYDGKQDTYASVANSGSTQYFHLRLPEISPIGRIIGVKPFIILAPGTGAGAGDGTLNASYGMWCPATNDWYPNTPVGDTPLNKADLRDGGYFPGDPWNLLDFSPAEIQGWRWTEKNGANYDQLVFRLEVVESGATANVIACGLKVSFLPATFQQTSLWDINEFRRRWENDRESLELVKGVGWFTKSAPDDGARFYFAANKAQMDNHGGDVTGVGNTNITHPVYIFKHFLWKICGGGLTTPTFESSTNFGSFATAHQDLGDIIQDVMCMRVLDPMTPDEMIERICTQVQLHIGKSMYTGKWYAVVYQQSPTADKYFLDRDGSTNYKWKYTEDMVDKSVSVGFTPLDECVNEVHVRMAPFAPTGQYTKESWVGPSGSASYDGTRDQDGSVGDREAYAVGSRDDLHIKKSVVLNLPDMSWPYGHFYRDYFFDRFHRPRMTLAFTTGPRGIGLEPGMVTLIDNEMQDYIPCPYYPGDGNGGGTAKEWDDVLFFVRDVELVSGDGAGGAPFLVHVVLEEIR